MLKKLRIQNFKVWEDTGEIDLAPITLFFGANSSGKSSIGQFLMMLKQTIESPAQTAVFYSGERNSAVQLGSYEEMVFGRKPKGININFKYQWSRNSSRATSYDRLHKMSSYNDLAFQAEIVPQGETQYTTNLKSTPETSYLPVTRGFKYTLFKNGEIQCSLGMKRKPHTSSKYEIESSNFKLEKQKSEQEDVNLGTPVHFYGFPPEVFTAYANIYDFVTGVHYLHEELFRDLFYLSPLRVKADRSSYYYTDPESVGYQGEDTVAAIVAARDREIVLPPIEKIQKRSFEEVIAYELQKMGLIEQFRVQQITKQVYGIQIRTKGSKTWVELPDVGFGISQVLPVLVQCFYAPEGSIILIDQPEVHLHPYAQAALADVMIDVINSRLIFEKTYEERFGTQVKRSLRTDYKKRNIQLIIETHSEHFLRRLQRRIAEGRLSEDNVSAYFANINAPPAKLERLKIDEFGNIQNWPENFFGDEMGDIIEQAKAATKKRRQQNTQGYGETNE